MAGLARGQLRLATTSVERLAEPLLAFRQNYPDVRVSIMETCAAEMGDLLDKGEADLCFTAQSPRMHGLKEREVFREQLALAVPPGHRWVGRSHLPVGDIENEPMVGYRVGHPRRTLLEDVSKRLGMRPRVVCEVVDSEALVNLVRAGLGVAIVPKSCPTSDGRRPSVIRVNVDHPAFWLTYKVVWLDGRYLSAAATAFRDFLVEYFAEHRVAPAAPGSEVVIDRAR